MSYTTLISCDQLKALQQQGRPLRVFDCSFDLMKPQAGQQQYIESHVAGALHADLDTALSAGHGKGDPDSTTASGGRHPLPTREAFARWLAANGVSGDTQVVVYDRQGANYCGRLWWMLKWCGHEAVAVLDGGLQAWVASGGATASGPQIAASPGNFTLSVPRAELVDAGQVLSRLGRPAQTLIDARALPRFKGEVEPLDPVAGHIPGALNRPFGQNLGADGKFKPADELKAEFAALLAGRDPASVVHHCGSGVSAVPNILAMEVAGMGRSALYAGSWSDWCSDTSRPMARG